jgi:flavin reductase (DIM6/NTAB) family NADH-FMN oxidoreductase RutF
VDAEAQRTLRNALGSFATGVTVITVWDGVAPHGITVNSFTSVSLSPPLVLWCVSDSANCAPVFAQGREFSVHVLASGQEELALRFARRSGDKFADQPWDRGPYGAPRLPGCAAEFHCRVTERLPGGDHWIILGEVLAHDVSERAPLLFHRGRFAT